MKSLKKLTSLILVIMMLVSVMTIASVSISAATDDVATDASYYLVGHFDGVDVGNEDSANQGYAMVDGQVTVTVKNTAYVCVKNSDSLWYMTDGWLGNNLTSATFYSTDDTSIAQFDKLYVPKGTYTFTLTENSDGTLTLSYAAATSVPSGPAEGYFLIGQFDGVMVGDGDDYASPGYAMVGGQVTVTVESVAYVCVKDKYSLWYMTNGWLGFDTTTADLYSVANTSIPQFDKLYVPAGTYTFTVVEKADGNLTLSYVEAGSIPTIAPTDAPTDAPTESKPAETPVAKLSATSYVYNGKVQTPSVIVKDSTGKTLTQNTDYTVAYASGRKNVGTYTVAVTYIGKYAGAETLCTLLSYKITPASATKCSASLSAKTYTYDGKVKTPTVTVKNASGTKLVKDTDFTVKYATGRKNVGDYKVTVTMKGNYSGTKTLNFTINPPKTTVKTLTPAKKSIKVTINKKTTQTTGYQIQYSTSKKFTGAKTKTITKNKTTSYTLKSLKAKKTYYVRVRTYKTVSGKKYYSAWSSYKSKKTK